MFLPAVTMARETKKKKKKNKQENNDISYAARKPLPKSSGSGNKDDDFSGSDYESDTTVMNRFLTKNTSVKIKLPRLPNEDDHDFLSRCTRAGIQRKKDLENEQARLALDSMLQDSVAAESAANKVDAFQAMMKIKLPLQFRPLPLPPLPGIKRAS